MALGLALVNGPGNGPGSVAGAAATEMAPAAVLCPNVAPPVANAGSSRPRAMSSRNIGGFSAGDANLATTIRSPTKVCPAISSGASSPSWGSVLASKTVVRLPSMM